MATGKGNEDMSTRRIADSQGVGEGGSLHGWDPYEVWLTRVKEPREQVARQRDQGPVDVHSERPVDTSDTARLRALSPALSR